MSVSIYHSFMRLLVLLLCILFLGLSPQNSFAQKNTQEQIEQKKQKGKQKGNAVREEIQRYMGYEELPARYLSLPYDVNINSNVQGQFVDISYFFLAFIPLIFLLGYWKRPLAGSLFMLGALCFLILSVANSIVVANKAQVLDSKADIAAFLSKTSFADAPIDYLVAQIHYTFRILYSPIDSLFNTVSGNSDHITYPLLILLFIGGFFVLLNRIQHHSIAIKALSAFTYLFSFLWLLLTAGIIWYGYLLIALGTLYFLYPFAQTNKTAAFRNKGFYYGGLVVMMIGLVSLFFFRTVSYQQAYDSKTAKGMLFDASVLNYQLGGLSNKETINTYFDGINPVLEQINSEDESLVFRIGTIFPYFIKKNDRRVLVDNQLGIFSNIATKYKNQQTIADVLKASNFKYLLVDLNTAQIDGTPERTLQTKFDRLMEFVYQNPRLDLLITDRKIARRGGTKLTNKVFLNPTNQERIAYGGTFAIYEIK